MRGVQKSEQMNIISLKNHLHKPKIASFMVAKYEMWWNIGDKTLLLKIGGSVERYEKGIE